MKHYKVIAHRGYSLRYPENTLQAFSAAVKAQADMIELDIAFTKDRKIVVIHDDSLDRTTSGHGAVAKHTLAQIRELDAGSWFSPTFKAEKIPTLDDVLDCVPNHIEINVEIKASAYENVASSLTIEWQLYQLLLRRKRLDQVIISSFESDFIRRLQQMSVPVRKALLYCRLTNQFSHLLEGIKLSDIAAIHFNADSVPVSEILDFHSRGFKTFAFTINDLEKMHFWLRHGVSGFFTDDPVGLGKGMLSSWV